MSWQGSLQFIHHHYPPKPHLSFYQSSSGCDDLGIDPNINKKKHVLAAILGQTKRSQPSFYPLSEWLMAENHAYIHCDKLTVILLT